MMTLTAAPLLTRATPTPEAPKVSTSPAASVRMTRSCWPTIGIKEAVVPPAATVMLPALPPDFRRLETWTVLLSTNVMALLAAVELPRRTARTVAVGWAVMAPVTSISEVEVVAPKVAPVAAVVRVASMTCAEALVAAKLLPPTK